MGIEILRHFLQLFFLPMAGIILAWFGLTLIEYLGASLTPTHVYVSVALGIVGLAAGVSRSESRILISVLTVGAVAVIGGIPIHLVLHAEDLSLLGNLFDLAGLGCLLLFFTLATLPFRVRLPETQHANRSRVSSPDEIRRADEEVGDGYGYPGMESAGAYQLWLREMKSKGLR